MRRILLAGAAVALISGCEQGVGLTVAQLQQCQDAAGERVCVTGTVEYFKLEGGFWAIRGDDNVNYDPHASLPDDFKQNGLRVFIVAKQRTDVGCIHQVGPIVEITSIERLRRQ